MRACILIVLIFIGVAHLSATTYYLSSSTGNDTNAGTSPATAWKTLNKGSTPNYDPGDSVLLMAGDTFVSSPINLTASDSGTNGAPVTIGRYGVGADPIVYGDHPDAVWESVPGHAGVYKTHPSYASISKCCQTNGTNYTITDRTAFGTTDEWLNSFTNGNWGIEDVLTMDIYIRTLDDNAPLPMHLWEDGIISLGSVYYVTVQNLDLRNGYKGVSCSGDHYLTIQSNHVSDCFYSGIFMTYVSHSEVFSNMVERIGDTPIYLQHYGSNWVHHNRISYATNQILNVVIPSPPTPERCGVGLQQGTNNLVEYNDIRHMEGSCFDYWLEIGTIVRWNYGFHTGGGAYPTGSGLRVYANVFNLDYMGGGCSASHDHDVGLSPGPDQGDVYVYNNLFYNFKSYGLYTATNSTGVQAYNNIFVLKTNTVGLVELHTNTINNFNLYWCTTGAPKGWYWNETRYTTLGAYQAVSLQDSNSVLADPLFMSANPVEAADFKLREGSPAIGMGTNMGAFADYSGVQFRNPPSVGPYEWNFRTAAATTLRVGTLRGP